MYHDVLTYPPPTGSAYGTAVTGTAVTDTPANHTVTTFFLRTGHDNFFSFVDDR
jgi:hypothetical protein